MSSERRAGVPEQLATAVCAVALLATPLTGVATVPSGLSDLVGSRASSGESALQSRGYNLHHAEKGSDRIWSYWWNPVQDECVVVVTMDGRYDSIGETPAPDCGQTATKEQGSKHNNAAAAAAAAAAILGLAALASKSHHRNDGKPHYSSASDTAEFERGYRDGLYHEGYHNYNSSSVYSEGYERGQEQKGYETSYRSRDGYYSGYRAHVNVADLEGARASSGERALQERGFRNAGGYKDQNKSHTFWWNGQTKQCIHAVTKDGEYRKLEDTTRDACR